MIGPNRHWLIGMRHWRGAYPDPNPRSETLTMSGMGSSNRAADDVGAIKARWDAIRKEEADQLALANEATEKRDREEAERAEKAVKDAKA